MNPQAKSQCDTGVFTQTCPQVMTASGSPHEGSWPSLRSWTKLRQAAIYTGTSKSRSMLSSGELIYPDIIKTTSHLVLDKTGFPRWIFYSQYDLSPSPVITPSSLTVKKPILSASQCGNSAAFWLPSAEWKDIILLTANGKPLLHINKSANEQHVLYYSYYS